MSETEAPERVWLMRGIVLAQLCGILMVVGALLEGVLDPLVGLLFGNPLLNGEAVALGTAGRLACGIAGAVLTGWGVSMAIVVRRLDSLDSRVVGSAFAAGTLAWFLLDNLVSVSLGAYYNVLGNTPFFALLFLPSWLMRSKLSATNAESATS